LLRAIEIQLDVANAEIRLDIANAEIQLKVVNAEIRPAKKGLKSDKSKRPKSGSRNSKPDIDIALWGAAAAAPQGGWILGPRCTLWI